MPLDRLALLDWLLPHCEPGTASIMYPKGSKEGPGWVQTPADVDRAVDAWRNGTLPTERFASITKDGKRYTVANGTRLGLVPHRNGMVARFCLDFDDHKGDGGNVHLVKAIERFLGAESIKFTSKGGKGLHCLYALDQPLASRNGSFFACVSPNNASSNSLDTALPKKPLRHSNSLESVSALSSGTPADCSPLIG